MAHQHGFPRGHRGFDDYRADTGRGSGWNAYPPNARDSRERGRDRDHGRDRDRIPEQARSRPASRERTAKKPRTISAPPSPGPASDVRPRQEGWASSSARPDLIRNGIPIGDITQALLEHDLLLADTATLHLQQDWLDREHKRHTAEYERSMQRHPEFQSVPELQNRFRDRHSREQTSLRELQRTNGAKRAAAAEKLVALVVHALPGILGDRVRGSEEQAFKDIRSDMKSHLQRLKDYCKSKLAEQHESHEALVAKQRSEFQAQLSKQREELEERLQDELARQREGFERQMLQLRADVAAEQTEQERRRREELQAQLCKYDELLRDSTQSRQPEQEETNSQVRDLDARLATLQDEHMSLRSGLLPLQERVLDQARELAERREDIRLLHGSFEEHATYVRSALGNVDLAAIDEIGEFFVDQWPGLKNKVADHDSRLAEISRHAGVGREPAGKPEVASNIGEDSWALIVEEINQKVDARHSLLEHNLSMRSAEEIRRRADSHDTLVMRMGNEWGGMLDDLKQQVDGLGQRVDASCERLDSTSQKANSSGRKADSLGQQLDGLGQRLGGLETRTKGLEELAASISQSMPDMGLVKGAVDRLAQDQTRTTDQIKDSYTIIEERMGLLSHQFTTLESRYNNMSTRAFAETVIAHMELFYPTNQYITTSIDQLNQQVRDLSRQRPGWPEADKRRVEASGEAADLPHRDMNGAGAGTGAGTGAGSARNARKRKRAEGVVNGGGAGTCLQPAATNGASVQRAS